VATTIAFIPIFFTGAGLVTLARYTYAMALCPSVRLFIKRQYSIETDERSWIFLTQSLPSTYSIFCFTEIWVYIKIRVLPYGTRFQTLDKLHKFRQSTSTVANVVDFI